MAELGCILFSLSIKNANALLHGTHKSQINSTINSWPSKTEGVGSKKKSETEQGPKAQDVPLEEFTYLVFTRMPGKSYCRQLRFLLLYWCYVC